jgi:hypothetical protein
MNIITEEDDWGFYVDIERNEEDNNNNRHHPFASPLPTSKPIPIPKPPKPPMQYVTIKPDRAPPMMVKDMINISNKRPDKEDLRTDGIELKNITYHGTTLIALIFLCLFL